MSPPVVPMRMRDKVILRVAGRSLIPLLVLFGLYVQFHGDFGPGGGFQAGVIIAAGFVLYGLIYGLEALRTLVPLRALEIEDVWTFSNDVLADRYAQIVFVKFGVFRVA